MHSAIELCFFPVPNHAEWSEQSDFFSIGKTHMFINPDRIKELPPVLNKDVGLERWFSR